MKTNNKPIENRFESKDLDGEAEDSDYLSSTLVLLASGKSG